MPRRARRRRRTNPADTLTPEGLAELLAGPTPRGSSFASPAARERLRRLHGLPRTKALAAREAWCDALRARRAEVV
jgi:hypothetical protein